MHGHVVLVGEGEHEQGTRRDERNHESKQAAEAGKDHTLGEHLTHDARALRTERRTDGELSAAAHAANQQKVGNVGAGDKQDERRDPGEQPQVVLIPVLHVLDTTAAGREHHMRSREKRLGALGGEHLEPGELLLQQRARLGLKQGERSARLDAPRT